jgi:hypothetical protein
MDLIHLRDSDELQVGDRKSPIADFSKAKAKKFIQFQKQVAKGDLHVVGRLF